MSNLQGFWSYAHADNESDNGRITQLRDDVIKEFGLITGDEISVFLDTEDITWGENWKEKIDESLSNVGFFVAILTPRYFKSVECRREFQKFVNEADRLGYQDLILSIQYAKVLGLLDGSNDDELMKLARTFQLKDWSDLRLENRESEKYRKGVADIAKSLYEANKRLEEHPSVVSYETDNGMIVPDEEIGVIDAIAAAEEKMNDAPVTIKAITEQLTKFSAFGQEATDQINVANSQSKGFSARLIVARKLASQLKEPAEIIFENANKLSMQMNDVDRGYRYIIERAAVEIQEDTQNRENFCKFFGAVRYLAQTSKESFVMIKKFIQTLESLVNLSKDLRPVVRRTQEGLTIMVSVEYLYDEWIRLIDETGIECDDFNVNVDVGV